MRAPINQIITIALFALVTGCTEDLDGSGDVVDTVDTVEKAGGVPAVDLALGLVGTTTCAAPKVLICHIPPGNPGNAHAICVGASAVEPHIAQHGDSVGSCSATREVQPPVCAPFGAECAVGGDCCSDACSKNVCIDRI